MSDNDRVAWMKRQAAMGGLSRREFGKLGLAAGLTAASAGDLFAATKTPAPDATIPKRGGSFKMATAAGSSKDTLAPASWRNAFMADVGQIAGNNLVSIDAKNMPQADLAEAFEPSDGAKKWVFKLRPGVTFHNGKSLTAADVVATYNYHRDRKTNSAARQALSGITDVKADGANTVIFTLARAHADFPYVTSDFHLPVFAAKDGGIDTSPGATTGPYIQDEFKPGAKFSAHRNPNYHRTDAAWFDDVELQAIADAGKRQDALLAGSVHYIDRVDVRNLGNLKRKRDIKITEVPGFGHYVAPMNCSMKPFDDVHVRQAVKWAINRDELVKRVLGGFGTTGNDTPLSPAMR